MCDARDLMGKTIIYGTNTAIFVLADTRPSKSDFMARAAVESASFAAEIVDRLYVHLIERTVDVRQEYSDYYALEYATIEDYLYVKMATSAKHVQFLRPFLDKAGFVGLLRRELGRDYQIGGLLEDYPAAREALMVVANAEWAGEFNEN